MKCVSRGTYPQVPYPDGQTPVNMLEVVTLNFTKITPYPNYNIRASYQSDSLQQTNCFLLIQILSDLKLFFKHAYGMQHTSL